MIPFTRNRVVPWNRVGPLGKVVLILEHEAGGLDSRNCVRSSRHIDDSVAAFDAETDSAVLWVGGIESVGHDPFIHTEATARFEDVEYLFINVLEVGGMDGRFDDIDRIECILGEIQMLDMVSRSPKLWWLWLSHHKVTLKEGDLLIQPSSL